jgi:hypothetical protein
VRSTDPELQETLGRVNADKKTREEIAELADTLRDNLDKIVHLNCASLSDRRTPT